MPKLNNNEKRLLIILGAGVFIVANALGYFLFSNVMDNLKLEEKGLRERMAKLEEAKANVDTADQLQQWMEQHLKEPLSEEDREIYLDGVVGRLSSDLANLELSKNATMSTVTGQYFIRSRYKTNAKGPWPEVKEFIYRLQSPEDFRLVTSLNMVPKKSEEDDSVQLVEVSLEIEKFWPLTGGAPPAAADGLTNNEQPAEESVQPPAGDSVTAAPPEGTPPAGEAVMEEPPAPADAVSPPPASPISPAPPAGVTTPTPDPNPDN